VDVPHLLRWGSPSIEDNRGQALTYRRSACQPVGVSARGQTRAWVCDSESSSQGSNHRKPSRTGVSVGGVRGSPFHGARSGLIHLLACCPNGGVPQTAATSVRARTLPHLPTHRGSHHSVPLTFAHRSSVGDAPVQGGYPSGRNIPERTALAAFRSAKQTSSEGCRLSPAQSSTRIGTSCGRPVKPAPQQPSTAHSPM